MDNNIDSFGPVENPTNSWELKSSDRISTYTILTNDIDWSCTCLGYFYRGACRHIREIKEQIAE